jgi:hypothetical protein
MKLLVCALTSQDTDRLNRLLFSAHNQKKKFDYAGVVMVNSLDKDYFVEAKKVADKYGWMCIGSESNGRPGKGKNACLTFFGEYDHGYDYMLLIDGDDFLYPTAFEQLEKLVKFKPDIVGLQTNDIIEKIYRPNNKHIQLTHNSYLYSWFDEMKNWHEEFPELSDYQKKMLGEVVTPDRIVLLSKQAAKLLRCSETLPVYEDLTMSLQARYYSKNGNLNYINTSDTYIYVYDKTHESSVCKVYDKTHNGDWSVYDIMFREDIKNIESEIKDFRAMDVPFVNCTKPTFSIEDKKKFCVDNLM